MLKTLREWRASKLLSIDRLAERAGTSNKTIVQIENGRQLASFRTMQRVSDALGIDPAEIAEFAAAIQQRSKNAA